MDKLRGRIAFIIDSHEFLEEVGNDVLHAESLNLAAEILAIPEIVGALRRPWDTTGAAELSGRSPL